MRWPLYFKLIFISWTSLLLGCEAKLSTRIASKADWQVVSLPRAPMPYNYCYTSEHYIPDSAHLGFWPMKYIRVGLHVIDRASHPFSLDSLTGPEALRGIFHYANRSLEFPEKMLLPRNYAPEPVPTQFRLHIEPDVLYAGDDGIYFHYDEDIAYYVHKGKDQNIGDRTSFDRYHLKSDSILNIFLHAYAPDTIPLVGSGSVGVAFVPEFFKIAAHWQPLADLWDYDQTFVHEAGHIYTLDHAWTTYDGCADTPTHSQCWSYGPGCDSVSNNVMDYTAIASTLSPCQVGRVQTVMAREGAQQRKYLSPGWCRGRADGDVVLRDSFRLRHASDLEGNLLLESGAYLEIECRLSIPAGKSITIMPGATLVLRSGARLHNSCGLEWTGVQLVVQGRKRGQLLVEDGGMLENVAEPIQFALPPVRT